MSKEKDFKCLLAQRGVLKIEFFHSAFADSYEKQVNEYGFTLGKDAEFAQKVGFGLVAAYIHGCFTESEYQRVLERFQKKILIANLKPMEIENETDNRKEEV